MIFNISTPTIYKQLADKYQIPINVIKVICNHPFQFAKKKISDDTNNKSIMFSYLFKLKPKKLCYGKREA